MTSTTEDTICIGTPAPCPSQQGQSVLREAASAVAGAGVEEFGADPVVEADAARDLLDVRADGLAQIGDFVDEADLGREEGVGGIFDELGRSPPGEQHRRLVEEQRAVDFAQDFAWPLVFGADDDPVGDLEVADRGAFAQEFGIGADAGAGGCAIALEDPGDLVPGSDRNRGLGDDDRWPGQRLGDLLCCCVDERQVGVAVLRCAGVPTAMNTASAPSMPALRSVVKFSRRMRRLVATSVSRPGSQIGIRPAQQLGDLALVLVDAGHVVTEVGEAGARYQSDIAGSDYSDPHGLAPWWMCEP